MEATEDYVTEGEQTDQLVCVLATMMKQFGQQPIWEDASNRADGAPSDNPDSMPTYPHKLADLVQPTNILSVSAGNGPGGVYRFRVAGKIAPLTNGELTVRAETTSVNYVASSGYTEIRGEVATGEVEAFRFDGAIYESEVPGNLVLKRNGDTVSASDITHTAFFKAAGDGDYSVRFSGGAAPAYTPQNPADPSDKITEHDDGSSTINGHVSGGGDIFYVSGDVVAAEIPDGVTAELAGQTIESKDSEPEPEPGPEPKPKPEPEPGTGDGNDGDAPSGNPWGNVKGGVLSTLDGIQAATKSAVEAGVTPVWRDLEAVEQDIGVLGERILKIENGRKSGGSPSAEDPSDLFSDNVKRIVNVIEAGADPTGQEPIDPVFSQETDSKGEIGFHFPAFREDGQRAEYLLEGFAPTVPHVECRAPYPGAILRPTQRNESSNWLQFGGDGAVLDGFILDYRGVEFAPFSSFYADNWQISRTVFKGYTGVGQFPDRMVYENNGDSVLNVAATAKNGVGTIDQVYMADGACPPGERDNRRAVFVQTTHKGRIAATDSWFENWCENTWYGTYGTGTSNFTRCVIKNSPIGLRTATGSKFKKCLFIKDGPVPWQRAALWQGGEPGSNRMRGVRIDSGDAHDPESGHEIIDCDFVFTDDSNFTMGPPIVAHDPAGTLRVKDSRIYLVQRNNDDPNRHDQWPAFDMHDYDHELDAGAKFWFDNVHVISDSQDSPAFSINNMDKASVKQFDVEVECPAGVADFDASEIEADWNVGTSPERANPQPPIEAPPANRIPKRREQ